MKMILNVGLVLSGLGLLVLAACSPGQGLTGIPSPPGQAKPVLSAKPAGEVEWERTLVVARQEANVVVYSSEGEWRNAFAEALSKKYGITLDVVTASSGDIAQRIMGEQRNKVYQADVLIGALNEFLTSYQAGGILQRIDDELLLPEVADPKRWWRGDLLWLDPEAKTYLAFREYVSAPIAINTDLVKPDEVKSWGNLLDPKWKGKIVIKDPTIAGGGQSMMSMLAYRIMDRDFVTKFVKQEPVLSRNDRLMVEWVARGRYPMVVVPRKDMFLEFANLGSPIAYVMPSEGTYLSVGAGFISRLKSSPHPNAAKAFINFFLSKEGQTLYSQISGYQSARNDVPTGHLPPLTIREPGKQYVSSVEKGFLEQQEELRKFVVELFVLLLR